MDFGVVVVFGGLLIGGVAFGSLLSVLRPCDDEAAAMHRHVARRALSWLPGGFRANRVRVQQKANSGLRG